jgi:surfeit locus 1 family protein
MIRRLLPPLLFGLIGCAILIGLGTWQVQRLDWKRTILADIEGRIVAAPVALPVQLDPDAHRYLPVAVAGQTTDQEIRVLVSRKQIGAGYRIIAAFLTDDGRRILIDRGFLREADYGVLRPPTEMQIIGNLHWPDEVDSYTPPPDLTRDIWFARDVPAMAAALGTEPVLVVVREISAPVAGLEPMPVDTSGIPNDHLQYAITWYLLALVWAGMTLFLLWRIRRRPA